MDLAGFGVIKHSQPKVVKPKMLGCKLSIGIIWQGGLKKKDVKQGLRVASWQIIWEGSAFSVFFFFFVAFLVEFLPLPISCCKPIYHTIPECQILYSKVPLAVCLHLSTSELRDANRLSLNLS